MEFGVKGAWSDLLEWIFFYSSDASSPKISWFQISFIGHITYFAIAYTSLCKLNYGYHN